MSWAGPCLVQVVLELAIGQVLDVRMPTGLQIRHPRLSDTASSRLGPRGSSSKNIGIARLGQQGRVHGPGSWSLPVHVARSRMDGWQGGVDRSDAPPPIRELLRSRDVLTAWFMAWRTLRSGQGAIGIR